METSSIIVWTVFALSVVVLIARAVLKNIEYNRGVYRTELFVVKELKNKALKYRYVCQLTRAGVKKFGRKITAYGNSVEESVAQAKSVLKENK